MKHKNSKGSKKLKVVELFAGVGGFKLGLCGTNKKPLNGYDLVWANQWEPATKTQHAAIVYSEKFHGGKEPNPHFNTDINAVVNMKKLPVPKHDVLVGGFPCQDYSVARTLSQATGIEGKKGVLWWAIHKILRKRVPNYIVLENVDRLLKSPAKQRGRDFGIILASLSDLGYIVEWRVINAADYGMPQRRRRTFILGYKKNSHIGKKVAKADANEWLTRNGVIASAFPVHQINRSMDWHAIEGGLADITEKFEHQFENTGIVIDRNFMSFRTAPNYDGPRKNLGDVLFQLSKIPQEYFIDRKALGQWKYLKGAKRDRRTAKNGFAYSYNEGPVAFPDDQNRPSRTIITGEGGSTPSRFKHVIKQGEHYRRLMPVELERLCMFPDGHTEHPTASNVKRAFFMGNALVVGVIERLGRALLASHES